jgi:L-serine dehydratase
MSKNVSIFNEVLGPVMHGPSSSHTAASYFIGRLIRNLLDDEPLTINIAFAERGSYAEVYSQQGSDLGFATGLMGWEITDERFFDALREAQDFGLSITFTVRELEEDNHPNAIEICGVSKGDREIRVIARSIGGGAVVLRRLNGWEVNITGDAYDYIVESVGHVAPKIALKLARDDKKVVEPSVEVRDGDAYVTAQRLRPLDESALNEIISSKGVRSVWTTKPTKFPKPGEPLFQSGEELVDYAKKQGCSLGEAALNYEAGLLGLTRDETIDEMWRRYELMAQAVKQGLKGEIRGMQLLEPSAQNIYEGEKRGSLAIGGLHTKAAARALAAMHVNSSMGVVCAAPTGGAAGTIPGVITTLVEEKKLDKLQTVKSLFAAGAVGMWVPSRDRSRWGHVICSSCGDNRRLSSAGAGRRGYLVPEHYGLPMRSGSGNGRDSMSYSERFGGLVSFRLRRSHSGRIPESRSSGRDDRCCNGSGQDASPGTSVHCPRWVGDHAIGPSDEEAQVEPSSDLTFF